MPHDQQPLDLDVIEARAAAATPGPWGTHRDLAAVYTVQARPRTTSTGMEDDGDIATLAPARTDAESYANARFIAHARTDITAMADEIRRLRAELAAAVRVSEALHRRLSEEQLAGSALYAALTMPTSQEQRQAALDKFTAVAQQVSGAETRPAVETHVVADDSDDPEHVDDCPGCETAARP